MRTNLDSVFLVGQAVARAMILRRRGKIINVCSVQSELGRPEHRAPHRQQGRGEDAHQGHGIIDWGPHGWVNGPGPVTFKTELTAALVNDEAFTRWLVGRIAFAPLGRREDLIGAAVFWPPTRPTSSTATCSTWTGRDGTP